MPPVLPQLSFHLNSIFVLGSSCIPAVGGVQYVYKVYKGTIWL